MVICPRTKNIVASIRRQWALCSSRHSDTLDNMIQLAEKLIKAVSSRNQDDDDVKLLPRIFQIYLPSDDGLADLLSFVISKFKDVFKIHHLQDLLTKAVSGKLFWTSKLLHQIYQHDLDQAGEEEKQKAKDAIFRDSLIDTALSNQDMYCMMLLDRGRMLIHITRELNVPQNYKYDIIKSINGDESTTIAKRINAILYVLQGTSGIIDKMMRDDDLDDRRARARDKLHFSSIIIDVILSKTIDVLLETVINLMIKELKSSSWVEKWVQMAIGCGVLQLPKNAKSVIHAKKILYETLEKDNWKMDESLCDSNAMRLCGWLRRDGL